MSKHDDDKAESHKPSHGAAGLQAGVEKRGVKVLSISEADGVVQLTLAVGAEVKAFSFADADATPEAVIEAFRQAGGTLPLPEDPATQAD